MIFIPAQLVYSVTGVRSPVVACNFLHSGGVEGRHTHIQGQSLPPPSGWFWSGAVLEMTQAEWGSCARHAASSSHENFLLVYRLRQMTGLTYNAFTVHVNANNYVFSSNYDQKYEKTSLSQPFVFILLTPPFLWVCVCKCIRVSVRACIYLFEEQICHHSEGISALWQQLKRTVWRLEKEIELR